ncbi:hypothetical protein [Sutcliffiella rhizosphaerae]|uniref:Rhomboid family intramembrane serine protease n=1 Tax=Sutcliffiella rhizosphaerae TaxID=2880967 RepID=A0ABM8YMR3_9BACI|nr:hypothetical protein [Sutcliffiella rhizosphaerae]CAG9621185.1 hypothetical protein BACCIP111883_01957 [Sutcliffiella rhizosphaerae]
MGIYSRERNLSAYILRHFHSHPRSIDLIKNDFNVNGALNHALVKSLKETQVRDRKVWDKFTDTEVERLIKLELYHYINRTKPNQRESKSPVTPPSKKPFRFPATLIIITLLLLYSIYQFVTRDFSHSTNSVQFVKTIDFSKELVLLIIGIIFVLIALPILERLYGAWKILFLFAIPGYLILPFQDAMVVNALSGSISGLMGIYLVLTLKKNDKVTLKKTWWIWGSFAIFFVVHFYMLGSLFSPYSLLTAITIGILLSLLVQPQTFRKELIKSEK